MPTVTTIASFPQAIRGPAGQLFRDSSGNLLGATELPNEGDGNTYEIAKMGDSYATTPAFLASVPPKQIPRG